jgi:lysozyme
MRAVPSIAAAFVAEHEGLRLESYADPGGAWTVGYGHTGPEVHAGLRVTPSRARAWLAEDLRTAAARLQGVVERGAIEALSEGQYSALISFVFNLGADPKWTIWKRVNARCFDAVPVEMMRFDRVGRTRLAGLTARRAAEVALWSGGAGTQGEAAPPSSYTRAEPTPPAPHLVKPLFASRTAITGAAQVVGGVSAGALTVQQTVAPYAQQAAVLGKLTAALAMFMAGCGVVLLAIKWLERREAQR